MKKKLALIMLLVTVCLLALTACAPAVESGETTVTIFIVKDGEELAHYERTTELGTVAELFYLLANEENSQFAYSSSTSFYGQFLNSVTVSTDENWVSLKLFPDAAQHEFCAFYHTVDDVKYRDYTIEPISFNGVSLYFSAMGIDGMPLIDGAAYLVTIDKY